MVVNGSLCARAGAAVALALLLAVTVGCGKKDSLPVTATGDADKFLYERGTEALNKKRWLRSREYFRNLVDNYPQSTFRPDAKLGLGDTYLGENSTESLILAINEFREFLTFFPTNERAHYAQYKLALSHFAQMLAPQRDQTETKEAIKEFENFVERYPNSPLLADGRKKLRECKDRLSDADYQVGLFYYHARWYPGAIMRFRAVLKQDAEYTGRDALYYYLADCYVKMQARAEALPLLDRLSKEFEKSEYLERGKKLMAEAQAPPPPPAPAKKK